MAKRAAGRKPGRKPIHRLTVMGNIDGGGRAIAAVPMHKPGEPYPLGLSMQRLHGPSFGGQAGFVVRLVGADGNMATMVLQAGGKDPATVQHALVRTLSDRTGTEIGSIDVPLTPEQTAASLNNLADAVAGDN